MKTTKENLESIVKEMMSSLSSFEHDLHFSRVVVDTILDMCTARSYEAVSNYEWLIKDVILGLAKNLKAELKSIFDSRLASVILEVCTRLEDVRKEALTPRLVTLLQDIEAVELLGRDGSFECLKAIMFVVGEYAHQDINESLPFEFAD